MTNSFSKIWSPLKKVGWHQDQRQSSHAVLLAPTENLYFTRPGRALTEHDSGKCLPVATWDKSDIWRFSQMKCHVTEERRFRWAALWRRLNPLWHVEVVFIIIIIISFLRVVACHYGHFTDNISLVSVMYTTALPARWQCSSCGFPCSRRAWWSCNPATSPADEPPGWRSSRPSWPSTCVSCSARVNWCVWVWNGEKRGQRQRGWQM